MQHLGDVVDARRVLGGDDRLHVDVAHERDLGLHRLRDVAVGAAHDRVGLDADGPQRGNGVLRRLGLEFAGRADVRHQRDVEEEHVVAADVVAHLARGLEERLALDVADGAADLRDDDVHVGARLSAHASLDLVGDVRNDLHRVAEVLAATLLGDDLRVHLAGGDVRRRGQIDVEEALVVTDVEVGLRAVVGHEDLAVLERIHGSRIDVEIRIQFLHRHAESARPEEAAEARSRQALPEGGNDASGDENVTGDMVLTGRISSSLHGTPEYQYRPMPGTNGAEISVSRPKHAIARGPQ